jgi:hypothetical protein
VVTPFRAKVIYMGRERDMATAQNIRRLQQLPYPERCNVGTGSHHSAVSSSPSFGIKNATLADVPRTNAVRLKDKTPKKWITWRSGGIFHRDLTWQHLRGEPADSPVACVFRSHPGRDSGGTWAPIPK